MKAADLEKWNNERRWDYAHAVLSLDANAPLFDYTGLPFQGETLAPFRIMLRDYYREVYLDGASLTLPKKRDKLLLRIEESLSVAYRDAYVAWLVQVFVYLPYEQSPGWAEWKSIFMRCSGRRPLWSRLGLPANLDLSVQQELEDAKIRTDDARDIRNELAAKPRSDWDCRVMAYRHIDQRAIEAGEPFSAIMLTVSFYMFYVFWKKMLDQLSSAETTRLWENAQAIAKELDIAPEDVLHPALLSIESSLGV
jgi:hypothetical protein